MSLSRKSAAKAVSFSAEEIAQRDAECAVRDQEAEKTADAAISKSNPDALVSCSYANSRTTSETVTPDSRKSQPGLSNLQQLVAVNHIPREGQSALFGCANERFPVGGVSSFNTKGRTPAAPGLMVMIKSLYIFVNTN